MGPPKRCTSSSSKRFDADPVVDRSPRALPASKIDLSCLDRDVSEQELDLLQLASRSMTKACTGSAEVVWGNPRQSELRSILLHNMPDDLFGHTIAPRFPCSTNAPKQSPVGHSGCGDLSIDSVFDPVWHGNSPDATGFAYQINYCPMVLPTLKVIETQVSEFTAAKPAAQ